MTENMSPDEKRKVLLKLHKQFGHASADRLQRLIQSSGNKDKDCFTILQQIVYDCEICQKFKRTKPKPAVGLPMASEYNETVVVDLHELEPGVWYGIFTSLTTLHVSAPETLLKLRSNLRLSIHSFTLGLVFMAPPGGCAVILEGNSTIERSETWLKTLTSRQ